MSKSILEIIPESLREQLFAEVQAELEKKNDPTNPEVEAKNKELRKKDVEAWAKNSQNPYNK
jgi:hypothetical protein